MNTYDELLAHAERCAQFAENSIDQAVAEKFRRLARDYRDLAAQAHRSLWTVDDGL